MCIKEGLKDVASGRNCQNWAVLLFFMKKVLSNAGAVVGRVRPDSEHG